MTLREIVEKYLEKEGYDGLYLPQHDCACLLNDLMPCDEPNENCEAGYRTPCDDPGMCEWGDEVDHYHMTSHQPARIQNEIQDEESSNDAG